MDLKSANADTGLYEDRWPATSSQVPAEPVAGAEAFSTAFIQFLWQNPCLRLCIQRLRSGGNSYPK